MCVYVLVCMYVCMYSYCRWNGQRLVRKTSLAQAFHGGVDEVLDPAYLRVTLMASQRIRCLADA